MALALKAGHFRNGSDPALHRKAQGIFLRFKTTCVALAARCSASVNGKLRRKEDPSAA
jgi:hypothetical protein